MPVTTKTMGLLVTAVIALVLIAVALMGINAGYFTNPSEPVQAQVQLDTGDQGPQGAFNVTMHRCWDPTGTTPAPERPSGGSYVLDIGLIDSPPSDWSVESSSAACVSPEVRFSSSAVVNPALQTGAVPLAWGPAVRLLAGPEVSMQDEGTEIIAALATVNFVGDGVTVTESGGVVTITIGD